MNKLKHPFRLESYGKTITFDLEVSTYEHNFEIYVDISKFRPFPAFSNPVLSDWINETQRFCEELSIQHMGAYPQSYTAALLTVCKKHIHEFKRIIDSDLFTYIDECLLVQEKLFENYGEILSLVDGQELWQYNKNFLFNNLSDNLYINVISKVPGEPTRLVPHKDLNLK